MKYWNWRPAEGKYNFGDELMGLVLAGVLPNEKHEWVSLPEAEIVGIGTVLRHIRGQIKPGTLIWGTGGGDNPHDVEGLRVLAVRGKLTRKRCGLPKDIVVGGPALLLPLYYPPAKKRYRLGIVRHFNDKTDYSALKPDIIIEALNDSALDVVHAITACEYIISSSLHGWIVAYAYSIPAVPLPDAVGESDKFADFLSCLDRPLEQIQQELLSALLSANRGELR